MGTSIGGVASPPIPGFDVHILGELLGCKLQPVDMKLRWDLKPKFDARNKGDVHLYRGAQFLLISNSGFSDDLVFHKNFSSYDKFLSVTGMRGRVIFFCIYDSGNSYGFSMFEDGQAIRHRFYSAGGVEPLRLMHSGPLAVEQPWHPVVLTEEEKKHFEPEEYNQVFRHAESQETLLEGSLNRFLVDAVLRDEFGFSPENGAIDGQAVQEQIYRAVPEMQPKADRPWWRGIFC